MMVYAFNSGTLETETGWIFEFQANSCYTVRPCFKTKVGEMAHLLALERTRVCFSAPTLDSFTNTC